MYRSFGKRYFDIFFAIVGIIILSPVFLVITLLIKLFDPGPVIFQQIRIGKNGKEFIFYKFRSMPVNTGDMPSDKLGSVDITPIGKFIRRTNADELPQLINILKGDMSIVGPRPPISSQVELIEARRGNGALACRPGLTGLAQIRSFDRMTVQKKAEFDGMYAASISLAADMRIIMGTFSYLLKPPPVY